MDVAIKKGIKELFRVIDRNYYPNNKEFKKELLKSLKIKTGNNNLVNICEQLIDIKENKL